MRPRLTIPFAIAASALLASPLAAFGAASGIMTWKSSSYVPDGYGGKALPVAGTSLAAALAAADAGKIISPSSYAVRWYVDGDLAGTKSGSSSFSFSVPRTGQDSVSLRASVPELGIDSFLDIPVVRPEAVIDRAKFPELVPLYYFFSIRDPRSLRVSWDNQADSVTVIARNPDDPLEFARGTISKNP